MFNTSFPSSFPVGLAGRSHGVRFTSQEGQTADSKILNNTHTSQAVPELGVCGMLKVYMEHRTATLIENCVADGKSNQKKKT